MWKKLLSWCHDSEVIFLSWVQVIAGLAISALPTIDPYLFQSLVGDRWFGIFLIAWGVLTNAARRYRADDLK